MAPGLPWRQGRTVMPIDRSKYRQIKQAQKAANPLDLDNYLSRDEGPGSYLSAAFEGVGEGVGSAVSGAGQILSLMAETIRDPVAAAKQIDLMKLSDEASAFLQNFSSLPPDQKQAIYNAAGQIVGGTTGAALGAGAGSVPLAGSGAIAGDQLAKLLGPMLGGSGFKNQKTGPGYVKDIAKLGTEASIGEGVGRGVAAGVPMALSPRKALGNTAKKPFTPTPERAALNVVADKAGIDLPLAARSGRPTAKWSEGVLNLLPTSRQVIRDSAETSLKQLSERGINPVLDRVYPTPVSPDDFADVARYRLGQKQATHVADMESTVGQLPTPYEGGAAYQRARGDTIEGLRQYGRELYEGNPAISGHMDDLIDMSDAGQRARLFLNENVASGDLEKIYPKAVVDRLRSIGALEPEVVRSAEIGGQRVVGDDLNKTLEQMAKGQGAESVDELIKSLHGRIPIEETTVKPEITLRDLQGLRTQILEAARGTRPDVRPLDRRTIFELIDTLNESVRNSSLPPETVNAWFDASSKYGDEARRIFKPQSKYGEGNIMADKGVGIPAERVIDTIVQPGGDQAIREGLQATTPRTGETPDLQTFRDATLGHKYIEPSRVPISGQPGQRRISPAAIQSTRYSMKPSVEDALFGGPNQTLEAATSPSRLAAESEAFTGPRAVALSSEQKGGEQILKHMAPEGNADYLRGSQDFMGPEAGQLNRAFLDDLIAKSTAPDRSIGSGMEPVLHPATLAKRIRKAQPSVEAAAGQEFGELNQMVDIGKNIKETEATFGNPSGTAVGGAAIGLGRKAMDTAGKTIDWIGQGGMAAGGAYLGGLPGAVAAIAGPWALAKGATNPKIARFLTSAPEAVAKTPSIVKTASGGLFRMPQAIDRSRESNQIDLSQYRRIR